MQQSQRDFRALQTITKGKKELDDFWLKNTHRH